MPPPLRCLSAPRWRPRSITVSRSSFSTTRRALAETPRQSRDHLLDSLASLAQTRSPSPSSQPSSFAGVRHVFLNREATATSTPAASASTSAPSSSQSADLSRRESLNVADSRRRYDSFDAGAAHLLEKLNHVQRRTQLQPLTPSPSNSPTQLADDDRKNFMQQDLTKAITRNWMPGDVYAPRDLGRTEMLQWSRGKDAKRDAFDLLGLEIEEQYKNFSVMSEFVTPMGRIKTAQETGLRPVNQRKIAKAIRRSVGVGLMPSIHRHPEILMSSKPNLAFGRRPRY